MTGIAPDPISEPTARRANAVLETACRREIMIATAESCTGGLVAALLTDCEGYSHVFDRGFVTYSEEAKRDLLGVDPGLIDKHSAVSREVALAMAEGAIARSQARLAVAITGFAGPTKEGEEGLVHLACRLEGGASLHREKHFGRIGRDAVRTAALEVALEMMEEALAE
ncbi:CinA family protein [Qipengyuania sediminis]|uniref:CinA family protein n=1 Tax=Qipengyuania sediminis TaxID=1532023 RepID=UPI001059E094|nr:CinA family protein [Qipengyuania sediminis]